MMRNLRNIGLTMFKLSKIMKCFFMMLVMSIASFYSVNAQTVISSLAELRSVVQLSDQTIEMEPGNYNIEDLESGSRNFPWTGSNNTIDLTGVYIDFPVGSGSSGQEYFLITGSNNTLKGGEFENTYVSGIEEITDFVAYNNDRDNLAYGAGPHIVIQGDGNSVIGTKLTVRGSFPYGYGSIYGIGSSSAFGLDKRAGIAVQGTNAIIDSCELQMRAFGHGIYIQEPSDNTVVKNTLVVGEVRSGADMIADNDPSSLPFQTDFLDFSTDFDNPVPIDPTVVHSLCEDGIRVYGGGGSVTVENCTVEKMRGGMRLYLSSGATVTNSIAIDNGIANWNLPSNGTVTNSSGNFAYDTFSDYRLNRNNTEAEWTIIPSPHATGPHNLMDVLGGGHTLVFHRTPGPLDLGDRAIVVTGSNSDITNETEYPVVLESSTSGNTIVSFGPVVDYGTGNTITQIDGTYDASLTIEAEDYTTMSGVETTTTTDEEGGDKVSSIDANDWMEYEMTVPAAGIYSFDYRVSGTSNIDFTVDLDDETIDAVALDAPGGDETWETIRSTSPIYLTEGVKTIRVTSSIAGWNLNWISLLAECYDTSITPYIETYDALGNVLSSEETTEITVYPGSILSMQPAEEIGGSWSWTGPNSFSSTERIIELSDLTKTQSGEYKVTFTNTCGQESEVSYDLMVTDELMIEAESYSSMSGVSNQTTTDTDGGDNVTEIAQDDWMEYTIEVPFLATYRFDYRIASETNEANFTVNIDSEQLEDVAFAATGGAQIWETVSTGMLYKLDAGEHTLRIASNSADWNINWIKLTVDQIVGECELPFQHEGFSVTEETIEWSSGAIDISCVSDVNVYIDIEGTEAIDGDDYLNVYYRLDGGDHIAIREVGGTFSKELAWVKGLSGQYVEVVVKSLSSSEFNTFKVSNISVFHGTNSLARIESEDYTEMEGIQTEITSDFEGGENVGWIENGDWMMYSDIDLTGIKRLSARLASSNRTSSVEVRLGSSSGTLIGTISVPNTGSNKTWQTAYTNLEEVEGLADVYIVFKGEDGYLFNINWMRFIGACESPWSTNDYEISNETKYYTSDALNILCYSKTEISLEIEGVGELTSSDYLKVSYKIDEAEAVIIYEGSGIIEKQELFVSDNIAGNTVELIIEGMSNQAEGQYLLSNITVSEYLPSIIIQENELGFCEMDGVIETAVEGSTGDGYVNTNDVLGATVNWSMESWIGQHFLTWRYSCATEFSARLLENGEEVLSEITFAATDGEWAEMTVEVSLSGDEKTISLESKSESGLGDIDYLEVKNKLLETIECQGVLNSDSDIFHKASLYPNPSENTVRVSITGGKYSSYTIYNMNGKLVRRAFIGIESKELLFNIESLERGVYVFKLEGDEGTENLKLLKK